MLSKSQAKLFFLVGTGVCFAIFIGLTIDTFTRIPQQTKSENLNASVIRGKHLWEVNNCMGCHTILGEGAYYAPELTKVYERRGEAFIRSVIKDPEAMFPGQRKMVNYHFDDNQINDLVAFLKWVGEMDLNGFPPKPDHQMAMASTPSTTPASSHAPAPQIFTQICVACHALDGQGGQVGPALDGIGSRRDENYLKKWLHNPTDIKPDAKMAKLPLADADIELLVSFLVTLK